jgi:hypothetical protein
LLLIAKSSFEQHRNEARQEAWRSLTVGPTSATDGKNLVIELCVVKVLRVSKTKKYAKWKWPSSDLNSKIEFQLLRPLPLVIARGNLKRLLIFKGQSIGLSRRAFNL